MQPSVSQMQSLHTIPAGRAQLSTFKRSSRERHFFTLLIGCVPPVSLTTRGSSAVVCAHLLRLRLSLSSCVRRLPSPSHGQRHGRQCGSDICCTSICTFRALLMEDILVGWCKHRRWVTGYERSCKPSSLVTWSWSSVTQTSQMVRPMTSWRERWEHRRSADSKSRTACCVAP